MIARLAATLARCSLSYVLVGICVAQEIPLVVTREIPVAEVSGGVMIGSPKCAPDGGVLIRPFDRNGNSTVVHVSPDGQYVTRFSMRPQPQLQVGQLFDFSAGPRGELYLLFSGRSEMYIAEFARNGSFKRTIPIDAGKLFPSQFVVTSEGEFVIGGHTGNRSALYIFDGTGKFVNKVTSFPDEFGVISRRLSGREQPNLEEQIRVIELSSLAAAENGRLYLARSTPVGPIYAISGTGEILRKFTLNSPSKDAQLVDVKVASGRLVVMFAVRDEDGNDRPNLQLLDVSTGQTIRHYTSGDARLGIGLGCYIDDSFTFVTTDKRGYLSLLASKAP